MPGKRHESWQNSLALTPCSGSREGCSILIRIIRLAALPLLKGCPLGDADMFYQKFNLMTPNQKFRNFLIIKFSDVLPWNVPQVIDELKICKILSKTDVPNAPLVYLAGRVRSFLLTLLIFYCRTIIFLTLISNFFRLDRAQKVPKETKSILTDQRRWLIE